MAGLLMTTPEQVSFQKPVIGPREYIAVGASGWPEVFDRCKTDKVVIDFCQPLDAFTLVTNFVKAQTVIRSQRQHYQTNWSDVTVYIAKVMGCKPKSIPSTVGVGFWALSLLVETESSEQSN